MTRMWRPLAAAVVLCVALGAGTAAAQTIIVRHVPPDVTIEASLGTNPPVTATRDNAGNAIAALNAVEGTSELAERVFLYSCDGRRRVSLVGRDATIPVIGAGCTRKDLTGVFVIRRVTTLVIDLADTTPFVLSAQGPAPKEWLGERLVQGEGAANTNRAAEGFLVFAGGGLTNFRGASAKACGPGAGCSPSDLRSGFTVGATYWFSRFLAADVSYGKDATLSSSGSGANYTFTTTLDPEVLMLSAKVGAPINERVTLYARIGADHHRATTTETDTLKDITATVDGVTQTVPGGTLVTSYRTQGWGWLWGGGMDIRVTSHIGLYLDGRIVQLKGSAENSEARRDLFSTSVQAGIRLGLGR